MKSILSASEMQAIDRATMEEHNVPSLVLMERAAMAVTDVILENYPEAHEIFVICGPGNNGGDGVAIARLLHLKGKQVVCTILGDERRYSEQLNAEIDIADSYQVPIFYTLDCDEVKKPDLVVDAMFGIGLSRGLEDKYAVVAECMNNTEVPVVSVDMPSGYDTNTGKLLGQVGVRADICVTFAYMKKGLLLGECKEAAGQVIVADVGIYAKDESGYARLLDDEILSKAPVRSVSANKGSCGKLLVIAGSENIYGACYLAAEAALVAGAGLVKIYTHVNNIQAIREALPEAMYLGYDSFNRDELLEQLQWADTVLMGPGLGMSETAEELVVTTLEHFTGPMVIDADGINLTAKHLDLLKKYTSPVVLTPHLKEMERLTSTKTADINYDMERVASIFATRHKCTVILKNFTTVIANAYTISYCNSGNEGLATPGSGDVLAGITASLLAQGCVEEDAASIAAYTHGCAGRRASERVGVKSVLARDIIEELRINKN